MSSAEGLTNREVAKRLFISPHTVNSHLRHTAAALVIAGEFPEVEASQAFGAALRDFFSS